MILDICMGSCFVAGTMATAPAAYKVIDRSILLPHYKRFLLDPLLAFIPARLHPNWISLAGHLACLGSFLLLLPAEPQCWRLIAAAILLQVYVFCDNADGGHARRTGQTSARGELLDHGLDLLNTSYIALIAAVAFHSGPVLTFALAVFLPSAAALTCWEQAQTGIFQMGRLNQIESVLALSVALVVDACVGTSVWQELQLGPVSAWIGIHVFTLALVALAEARRFLRVKRVGAPVAAALTFLLLQSVIASTFFVKGTGLAVAVFLTIVVAVHFGSQSLLLRLRVEQARVDHVIVFGTIAMLCALLGSVSEMGHAIAPWIAWGCVALFALAAMTEARRAFAIAEPTKKR